MPARSLHRRIAAALVGLLIITGAATLPAHAQPDAAISATVAQQIATLLAAKESRSPAEQKVDSNLLYAAMQQAGQASGALATIDTGVEIGPGQMASVDITAHVNDGLLARIRALGGQIVASYPAFHSLRAELPIAQLTTIAGWDDVIFVRPALEEVTAGQPESPSLAQTKTNTSEGDATHRADEMRATYGFTGAGVKVCVLSNGVNSLTSLQAAGDLPAVTVLPGQAGSGDEGSAMLEIVHDLAPGAQLFYATGSGGAANFARNILDLYNNYGCDILVDDITYFTDSSFQLGQAPSVFSTWDAGVISEAMNTVTTDGALFFTSAGNAGNLSDGTAGVWEGDFASAGPAPSLIGGDGEVHDFAPDAGVQGYNTITESSTRWLTLSWADPLGGSGNDYDLFLLNSAGTTILGQSTNRQSGTQDPFEYIVTQVAGARVVVIKHADAADRFLRVNTDRGKLQFGTDGQAYGHHVAVGTGIYAVAASPAYGPYPGAFSATSVSETFSSDGPRRHFFASDGTPFTLGNSSSTGGQVAEKPDLTAADGVSCAAPGFNPFYGTSAAAPHAGALAALLLSGRPTLTQAQMRTLLTTAPGAIDIENAGFDRTTGAGVLDALGLAQSLGTMTGSLLTFDNLKVIEGARSNGNGRVEPGESAYITAQVANATLAAASDVQLSFTITSPASGVQVISQPVAAGTIAASSSYSLAAQQAIVSIAPSVACGTQISYQITASYGGSGSNSPQSISASFTLGVIDPIITTLDSTAPPASPQYVATTGTQTGRLARNGTVSSCGAPKTSPGLTALTGARRYDAYTFTNTSGGSACVTVGLTNSNGTLFSAAYGSAGFNPANPLANYLADPGINATSYSFTAAAGAQFTVVVHEVEVGGGLGQGYTLSVSGGAGCAAAPAQPASIAMTGGGDQSAFIGQAFATQLQATVRDSNGDPAPEVLVSFSAPGSGAGATFPAGSSAVSDAGGHASVPVTANGAAGSYSVSASISGAASITPASFSLTNRAKVLLPLLAR